MKKIVLILSTILIMNCVSACGSNTETDTINDEVDVAEDTETEEESEPLTENDLDGLVEGLDDHFVLQDSENVDYMYGVTYNTTVEEPDDKDTVQTSDDDRTKKTTPVITKVRADASKIDASTPGTYTVTYTVTVNRKAYDTYKAQEIKNEKDDAAVNETADVSQNDKDSNKDQINETDANDQTENNDQSIEQTNSEPKITGADGSDKDDTDNEIEQEDDVDPDDLEDIIIEKEVEIVDKETAEELVNNGDEVWASDNENYADVLEKEKTESTNKDTEKSTNTQESVSTDTTSNDTSGSNTSSKTDSNTGSTGNNTSTNNSNKNSNTTSSSSSSSGETSSGGSSNDASTKTTSCDHNWVATYHEATGHYENVLVQAAYDEKVATGTTYICCGCGYKTTNINEMSQHQFSCQSAQTTRVNYETIHHDAVYEQKWVQDSAAYTTYKCSKCGATK